MIYLLIFQMNQPEIPSFATSYFTFLPQLPKLILIVVTDNAIQINKSKLMKHYQQKTNYDVCFVLSAQSINFYTINVSFNRENERYTGIYIFPIRIIKCSSLLFNTLRDFSILPTSNGLSVLN